MNALPSSRVLVTGLPAAGKTSLAKAIAASTGATHVEVDRLYFGPCYAVRPEFEAELAEALALESWVMDDVGYAESRDQTWRRADTLVWLDLPYPLPAVRAVRRTWRRLRAGTELLPGCRESWLGWLTPKHPVRLSLTRHWAERRAMEQRLADPQWQHLTVIRLRSRAAVSEFLGGAAVPLVA